MATSKGMIGAIVGLAIVGSLASGCGTSHRKAMETERMLAAAGFQMRVNDSVPEAQNMKDLPQREIFPEQYQGKNYFVYADDEYCQCIYVGTEEAYQRFSRMAVESKLAHQRLSASRAQANAALHWGAWGPFYRPWY